MGEGQGDHRLGEELLVWGRWVGEELVHCGAGNTNMYNNVMLEFTHLDRQGKTKG